MNLIAITISLLSLSLSGLSFYWTNLRTKKKLYLVPMSFCHNSGVPQFAFVNNGNKDILITRVSAYFDFAKSRTWLQQNIEFIRSQLLKPGESCICKIGYTNGFLPTKQLVGLLPNSDGIRYFDFTLLIEWVDGTGNIKKSLIHIFDFKLNADGGYSMSQVLTERINLYSLPVADVPVWR